MRRTSLALGLAALASFNGAASAETPNAGEAPAPTRAECLDAHHSAQELRKSSKLLEAQEKLLICSSASCPGAVISDCGNWISELEQSTPSIVFEVRHDGKLAREAKVLVDGQEVGDWSHALKVNPGQHSLRVELPPFPAHEESVVLPEGQRMRMVPVEFKEQVAKPAEQAAGGEGSAPAERKRPTPVVVYPLLAVGVVGLGAFGTLALLGKSKQKDLEGSCSPHCTSDDLKPMKRLYAIGDISAGVGAAALLGAAIVYLGRPSESTEHAGRWTFGVDGVSPAGHGALVLSARQTW